MNYLICGSPLIISNSHYRRENKNPNPYHSIFHVQLGLSNQVSNAACFNCTS